MSYEVIILSFPSRKSHDNINTSCRVTHERKETHFQQRPGGQLQGRKLFAELGHAVLTAVQSVGKQAGEFILLGDERLIIRGKNKDVTATGCDGGVGAHCS